MEEDKKPESAQESTSLEPDSGASAPAQTDNPQPIGQDGRPIASVDPGIAPETDNVKKPSGLKALFHRINLYLLAFIFLLVIGIAISVVTYLNSKKQPLPPQIASQNLTESQLKQIANSNATVGGSGQTLTIQGNAIIDGQALVKGDLNVAGAIKSGGDLTTQNIQAGNLTASGNANLGPTQTQKLQVTNGLIVQGDVTLENNLAVAGTSTFSGAITASQLNVTNIVISGNGQLQVPGHIAFPGPSPTRTSVDRSVLGGAGSATVSGSDTSGIINVGTGSGTQPGCFVTITFNKPFASDPHVFIGPVGAGAGATEYYTISSKTQMQLCSANAPPANQNFSFNYFITD